MENSSNSDAGPVIVGIGASAGGLQALKELFSEIPRDSGLAFVVMVHLSPEHLSMLANVLQPFSAIQVHQVTESTRIEPDRIYVVPPASNLSTIDSHLRLSDRASKRGVRSPIDHFFETLADTHPERCIGVILSGMGTDGTVGIKKIKEQGGLTLVQDPNEAEFEAMPQNAIATRLIDLILPAREMPRHIFRFAHTRPRIAISDSTESISGQDRQVLEQIFAQLRAHTEQDFSKDKRSTILRRIRRRMRLHQKELLGDYLEFLRQIPGEARLLAEEFLVTVPRSSRDACECEASLHREPSVSYGALHEKMVERHSLPSILVDQDFRIVHASEHAGRYLQVPGGEISANIFKLLRDELRKELTAALQAASEHGQSTRSAPVPMQIDGQERLVILHVRRSGVAPLDGLYLVIFDEMQPAEWHASLADLTRHTVEPEPIEAHLRTVISQHETSVMELRAANEELLSSLQEVESRKEELRSMNEELQTVTHENRLRIDELNKLANDLNNLMAATEIATLFLDRELRIMRVTRQVGELFNIRPGDQGRPLTDLTHHLRYDKLQEDAARVLERLTPIEREIQSEDGDWYLTRILPYRISQERIQGLVITLVNITHHKKVELALRNSEEAFRALVSASAQIVWTTDAHGQLIEDSPSWRIFTGQRFEQLRGTGWLDTVHSDDRDGVRAGWFAAVETESPFTAEFRLRHANGSWRWTHIRAVPLHDENRRLRGYVAMNADITERRHSEEALRQADRRKDEFMAALGHELRNLLAPMRTGMDLFERLLPDDPKLQQIRRLNDRQIVHLTRLVDDLLDVSRIKSGRMELQMQRIDLRDTVRTAVTRMETLMNERGHRFSLEQYVEPLIIDGDETRLVQIVTNLLSNAAKYTPEGGRIRIGTERVEQDAVITVTDSGMGISPDTLTNIFEVFWQGPSGPSQPDSGLGLGLTLVQQLVGLHGGTVEANSAGPGQGSVFTVRLPLAAAQAAESAPQAVRDMNRA